MRTFFVNAKVNVAVAAHSAKAKVASVKARKARKAAAVQQAVANLVPAKATRAVKVSKPVVAKFVAAVKVKFTAPLSVRINLIGLRVKAVRLARLAARFAVRTVFYMALFATAATVYSALGANAFWLVYAVFIFAAFYYTRPAV